MRLFLARGFPSAPVFFRSHQRPLSTITLARPAPEPTLETQQPDQLEEQQPPPSEGTASPNRQARPIPTADSPAPTPPQPLIYPSAPSTHHTDLPSFLAYAARTSLSPSSTVYVGTHYEYTASLALARYGLSLRRIGGVADGGIDLLGTWTLPAASSSSPSTSQGNTRTQPKLKVLAQCKAVQRPGPHLVRELEGAFVAAPAGWRGRTGVVGLLVAEKAATKGIREALARSRWPMGFVACSRGGKVEQFLWNRRAEEEGLEGLGVGMRYVLDGERGGEGEKELVLTWKGRNLPFVEESEG